jgi:glycine/D-amino acid oxidase-like deaminating enzyme
MFDYGVVGNGLLGAAAAAELAGKGFSVCVAGARYAASDRYFSSHEDDSRIHRTWHRDDYWETLSAVNHPALLALERETGTAIFTPSPVYYDFQELSFVPAPEGDAYLDANGFAYLDKCGGIIDPRRYIAALNASAVRRGASIRQGVVERVDPVSGGYRISVPAQPFDCRKVMDTRGVHAPADAGVRVQAKILLFFTHERGPERHCFLKTGADSSPFRDVYACVDIGRANGRSLSKFGFSERRPVFLEPGDAVTHWFRTGYRDYPHLDEALEQVGAAGLGRAHDVVVRPCAFTVTEDARPRVRIDGDRLTLGGCNGMAAKCCQALVSRVLEDHGF